VAVIKRVPVKKFNGYPGRFKKVDSQFSSDSAGCALRALVMEDGDVIGLWHPTMPIA